MACTFDLTIMMTQGKSDEPWPEIPFDLVIEILRRVPAKSLMRFKSVSKLWSSLIYSKYFTNLFSKVSSSSPRVYMSLGFFKSPVQDVIILSSSSCLDSDITSMSSLVLDQDLTIQAMKGYSISHVYRGLICFSKGPSAHIYNTTTRQLVELPSIEESKILADGYTGRTRIMFMYTIGHDPVHDTYKLVCTVKRLSVSGALDFISEHWILLLGADVTGGWREIVHIGSQPHYPLREGLTISNGRMYYFASVDLSYPDQVLLVSVDIDSEEISFVQIPDHYWSHSYSLIDYGGRLSILDHKDFIEKGMTELIVLEDEEKNRWSRNNLVLHPSQMEMVNSDNWMVGGTTINGEVILLLVNTTRTRTGDITHKVKPQATNLFHVLLYNPQKNHIRKVEIKESSSRYLDRVWRVIGFDDVENLIRL